MIAKRTEGATIEQLAKSYGISSTTVTKRINLARQADLVGIAREVIVDKLIAKAIAVVEKELNNGNYLAAKDVLFGTNVLQKSGVSTITHVSSTPTLDAIRAEAIDVESVNKEKDL